MTKLIKKLLGVNSLLLIGLFYTLFISIAFLLPTNDLPEVRYVNDKLIHATLYIVLSFVWLLYSFIYNNRRVLLKNLLTVVVLCFIYGIIIELVQQFFITSRQGDIKDVLANTIGTFIGTWVFWNVKNRIKT